MPHPLILGLALVLAACTDGNDAASDTDPSGRDVTSELAGAWVADGTGTVFGAPALGEVAYLVFDPTHTEGGSAGILSFFGTHGETGILSCEVALYADPADGALLLSSNRVFGGSKILLSQVEGDVLKVTSIAGDEGSGVQLVSGTRSETFHRVDAVPEAARCGEATAAATARFDLTPSKLGNLFHDGADLRIRTGLGEIVALDMASGTFEGDEAPSDTDEPPSDADEPPFGLDSGYAEVVFAQGRDVWGHCGCDVRIELGRSKRDGTVLDEIDSWDDLGIPIAFDYGAYDGTHLWVGGGTFTIYNDPVLLQIDAEAEPDVLVESHELAFTPRAIAVLDDTLYAIVDTSLVRFDPSTGKADATWSLPVSAGPWTRLTSDGEHLYVGATVREEEGTWVEVVRLDPLE